MRPSLRDNRGFTLIELLVTILIIGILAAIAVPAFLNQRAKAQDSSAKSNARNMLTFMETCWQDLGGYVGCRAVLTPAVTHLPTGAGTGQVRIVTEAATGFILTATSSSGNTFTISHSLGAEYVRSCLPKGKGGCPASGSW